MVAAKKGWLSPTSLGCLSRVVDGAAAGEGRGAVNGADFEGSTSCGSFKDSRRASFSMFVDVTLAGLDPRKLLEAVLDALEKLNVSHHEPFAKSVS